jgi:hypothetical protein
MGLGKNAPSQYVTLNTHTSVRAPGVTLTAGTIPTVSVAGVVTAAVETGYAPVKLYHLASDGAVSAGAVTMQGSNDGTNWFNTGSAITPGNGAGTFATLATDTQAWKFVRARVSTTLVGAGNIAVTVHL